MGSNQSQQRRHYQRPYTYNREATTTYSDMSTVARQKRGLARVLLERKCRFLGRFYAKELSEANLSRLRNHIRLTKGQKTKLRLTSEGIGSGSKFGTIFKNKLPAEFTPLADIIDIFTDNRFGNILCIAMKFPDGNYEIQAYRMFDEGTARQFQYAYSCLPSGDHPAHTPVPYDHNTSQWSNNDNWMLKDEGNLTSEPVTRRNGLRKTTSLHNAFETTDTRGHNRSFSPSWTTREDHVSSLGFTSAKGNIGKKLTDVSARDMDYQTYTGGPDDDSLSQGSGDSNEELRWRLHNLSREVKNIRSTMDDRHTSTRRRHNTSMMNGYVPRQDGKSKHYVLTHHRDLDDRWSDDGSDVTDQFDGLLVDSRAGTVKASVGDHRPGGYHGNTNQSNSHTGYHVGTASTKIGQGRRMNGHISRLPNGEIIKQENGRALKVNNNPNHLMYVDDMKEAKRYHTVDPHRSPHGKARSTDGYRSTAANRATHHRAPSETSFDGGNTLAKARVSRPVDKIYLPTGGGHNDYYVINPRATGRDMQNYAHSDIGATRYDHTNRRQKTTPSNA